jgi:hypothetical protein
MPDATVKSMMQGALTAIRQQGDNKLIWIEGNGYSSGAWFAIQTAWIVDPANNFVYSAHEYPGTSGNQTVYDSTLVNQFLQDCTAFYDWCMNNHLRCSIGEIGWPGANTSSDWQQFNASVDQAYQLFDDAKMDVTQFHASGAYKEALTSYTASSPGVTAGAPGTVHAIDTAQTQSLVVEAHPSF